jgi:hypothetical protein
MIKIKQLIDLNKDLYNVFFEYCVKSKPYDFCELNSIKLRNFKINEYYNSLLSICEIFECKEDDKIVWYVFLSNQDDHLILEFLIGNHNDFSPPFLIKNLHEIFILAQKTFDKSIIKSTIQRRYKKQKFINWIKRYDKVCEIRELNNKTEIFWKNERLN